MHIKTRSHKQKSGNMELLIALLIAFGVTTNKEEAKHFANDSEMVKKMLVEKGYDEVKIKEYKESIIGLEESDM
jgi:hypothetical protein